MLRPARAGKQADFRRLGVPEAAGMGCDMVRYDVQAL